MIRPFLSRRKLEMEDPPAKPASEVGSGAENPPVDEKALLDELLLEDVLIEDISIDGMCGVY
jgi:mycofactocin precursor